MRPLSLPRMMAARGMAQCNKFGIAFEPDLDALLSREDIDAVFITSPTNQHAGHVIAAVQAGKHVLLQKPMTLSLEDCDAIIAATQDVKFSMCYQMRADPVNQEMKALLDEGAVGKVALIRRRHAIGALLNPAFARPDNWHVDLGQNMGMFMDDASHAADWFYWMLGRPSSVMAEIGNIVTDIAPDDNGVALYRFAQQEIGILLNSSTMLAAEATTEIYGDQGVIVQNYGDGPSSSLPRLAGASILKIFRAGASDWEAIDVPAQTQPQRISAVPRPLVDFLKAEGPPLATAEEGKIAIEMILAAYESAREGRRVYLSP